MLAEIYPYLILCGCTIGAVLLYLWRQGLAVNRLNLALISLNEEQQHDTLRFLQAAWPILARAHLRGMRWQLSWFGVPVTGQTGTCVGRRIQHAVQAPEMQLDIQIYTQRSSGEQSYFVETVIATFLLLLRTNMLIKSNATSATFMQMAKLNLFLQHDIKNIAQFIQLMTDQLEHMAPEQSEMVLANLRNVGPLVRQRADRIVQTISGGQRPRQEKRMLNLREQALKSAQLFLMPLHITGDAEIYLYESNLDCALENILKNYYDESLREGHTKPTVEVIIETHADKIAMRLFAAQPAPPQLQLERLFEPFWSSDPAGTGIGLYQAKQLLESAGGSLQAHRNSDSYLEFIIHLPHSANAQT